MAKSHIITGLDIGTSAIKVLCAAEKPEGGLEILSQASLPSFGVRRGVVIRVDEISQRINKIFAKIQEEIGQKIEEVFVNINGSHLSSFKSRGNVIVSQANQTISEKDVDRVLQSAQTISLPPNQEILDIFPIEFTVDGQEKVKEVLGMRGTRLEVEVLALSAFSPYLKNLTDAVLDAGFQIADIIPSPLASARACLTPQEKELGTALIDIGAGTSTLAVYQEGNLVHLAFFPIGSEHITNDIAIGLRSDIELAERIKREFGTCILQGSERNKKEKIELPEEGTLTFSHKMLNRIIVARISEIFEQVNKEFKENSFFLPGGVVLVGGGAKLPKIIEFARKELKLPTKIGKITDEIIGLEENDLAWSVACGLVLQGLEIESYEHLALGEKIGEKLKKIFRIFIP